MTRLDSILDGALSVTFLAGWLAATAVLFVDGPWWLALTGLILGVPFAAAAVGSRCARRSTPSYATPASAVLEPPFSRN